MEMSKLQSEIDEFAEERDWEQFHTVKNLILALVGEVGELAEIVQWKTDLEIETELSPVGLLVHAITEPVSYDSDLKSRLEEELADYMKETEKKVLLKNEGVEIVECIDGIEEVKNTTSLVNDQVDHIEQTTL